MKGIILAGGSGTRLYPITKGISKQLMPIYDKPMIYYPISLLMMANIKDIAIITTRESQSDFIELLQDGKDLGINLTYIIQEQPNGLAEAFLLAEDFIGDDVCAMALGDNIFYGDDLKEKLMEAVQNTLDGNATIFGFKVNNPEAFGVMEINEHNEVISIEEKPENPKSDIIATGLYFYPKGVSKMAKTIKPSKRGELEITTLNDLYLKKGNLKVITLDKKYKWFDTGTFESLFETINFIRDIETNNQKLIGSPEEIAYKNKWINEEKLQELIHTYSKNNYGKYLKIMKEESEVE